MAEAKHQFHRGERHFSVGKLWIAVHENDIVSIPIEHLAPMLDVWIWFEGTPNEVMSGSVADKEHHHERVARADATAPIIVSELVLDDGGDLYAEIRERGGKYDVLDGIHRLYKQVQAGNTHVRAVVATKAQIDASELPSEK